MLKDITYSEFEAGFKVLEMNRSYWEMDSEYSYKFKIVEHTYNNWESTSRDSIPYVACLLAHLLRANDRIFR